MNIENMIDYLDDLNQIVAETRDAADFLPDGKAKEMVDRVLYECMGDIDELIDAIGNLKD